MGSAEREERIRYFVDDVWNGRDYNACSKLYHQDYVSPHGTGPEAKAAPIRANHVAFPDLHVTIDDLIISGDKAVLRLTLTGTDSGGYAGRSPTGRTVEEWGVFVMEFQDDLVIREFMGADKLGLFIQLGVIQDPWPKP